MSPMSDKRSELEALALSKVQRAGLRDLSFRTLADEVGIKSSSVHYYFPEKSDLTATLIDNYSKQFMQRLQQLSDGRGALRGKLMAFVDLFEDAAANDKLCLCGMLAAELTALDDECRSLLSLFFKHSEAWLTGVLKEHKADVASSLPPAKLAAVMMSGLEGALLLDRVHGAGVHLQAQRQLISSFVGSERQR
jgi:TetR/AcrR family transcriptional regulator, transcriptional repressor for nem operon